jgi:hypothetical protein
MRIGIDSWLKRRLYRQRRRSNERQPKADLPAGQVHLLSMACDTLLLRQLDDLIRSRAVDSAHWPNVAR